MTPSPASDVPVSDAHRRAGIAAHAADEKKGEDIVVLDVGDIISIAEAFVLVERERTRAQVRTIVDEIELALKLSDDGEPRERRGTRRRDVGAHGLRRRHRARVPRRDARRTTTSTGSGPTPRVVEWDRRSPTYS